MVDKEAEAPASVEETRAEIESLLGVAVENLKHGLETGGKKTVKHICKVCKNKDFIEVEVFDAELSIKAVSALSQAAPRLATKDEGSAKAVKLLVDISELPSAEIAERIAELEARLERDSATE